LRCTLRGTARTIAILPVKSFGAAKQRLADMLGAGSRQALAQAMFSDVLSTLRRVPGLDEIAVVTGDRAAESAASGGRVTVLHDSAQTGQSNAALIGIRHALEAGCDRAVLVPGDTPLLEPDEVARLIGGARGVVIVPDRHGTGTNALVPIASRAIWRRRRRRACPTGRSRCRAWPSTWTHPTTLPSWRRRSRPGAATRRPRAGP